MRGSTCWRLLTKSPLAPVWCLVLILGSCTPDDHPRQHEMSLETDTSTAEPSLVEPPSVSGLPQSHIEAVALADDYGARLREQVQAEVAAQADPAPFLAHLLSFADSASSFAMVEALSSLNSTSPDAVEVELRVVETLHGPSIGSSMVLSQRAYNGALGECGTFKPLAGRQYAVLVTPTTEGFRLVAQDDYYNGWFYVLDDGRFQVDRGPIFDRETLAQHFEGVAP